ncbi:MAG: putative DNA modification/repair radical SAM protein, partial [Firmicutes bacterium]|nr:putative DNA modification/repair radical SAM protein [Bacillota bacterium]
SSAVERNPDYTSERMARCLELLRQKHGFAGYIHAKIIPGTSPELVARLGALADRVSVNAEFPSKKSLELLAPRKTFDDILAPMGQIREALEERRHLPGPGAARKTELTYLPVNDPLRPDAFPVAYERSLNYKNRFAPAGQTTQMIIGAGGETDRQILRVSDGFYKHFRMKRVYFSAYIPLNDSPNLPSLLTPPPLKREHRLYQADWLMRFYGFKAEEILDGDDPFLDPELDPKVMWALRHLDQFPIEINKAPLELLVRIPGVGTTSARRILRQRRMAAVKFDDLKKIGVVVKRARYFLTCSGRYYGGPQEDPLFLRGRILAEERLPVAEAGPLSREQIRKSLLPIDDNIQISMFQMGTEGSHGLLV